MNHTIKNFSLLMILLTALSACTSEEADYASNKLSLVVYSLQFQEENVSSALKALPSGYTIFTPSDPIAINVFMTSPGKRPIAGSFSYDGTSWESDIMVEEGRQYYLYGFMPKNALTPSSVAPYDGSYASGVELSVTNLPAVSTTDFCVITGVLQGDASQTDINLVEGLQQGKFNFVGRSPSQGNYVYLLLNHLYAGLRLQMRVNSTYNELRTIKLRSLRLQSTKGEVLTANITLQSNNTGTNPLTSVSWTPTTIGTSEQTLFTDAAGHTLLTNFEELAFGYFASDTEVIPKLICVYDVYDKKGNLIRSNCVSENGLPQLCRLQPGQRTQLSVTVNPTYLYVLADPDLDNPTITIE